MDNQVLDKEKVTLRIDYEDVDTWPTWCVRESRDCKQCHFQGKILCHPRFRQGVIKPPISRHEQVLILLKKGVLPIQVHHSTGAKLFTIYSIRQKLVLKGEVKPLIYRHPESLRMEILEYVREHPDEQYKTIAPKFKVEPSYISRLCGKNGIHRRKRVDAQRRELINRAIKTLEDNPGASISAVAEKLGMAPTTLQHHLHAAGKLAINHEARVFLSAVREEVKAGVLEALKIYFGK